MGFSGIVFVIDQAQYTFTRIKSHGLSKVEQAESSRINLTLLNPKEFVNRQQYLFCSSKSIYVCLLKEVKSGAPQGALLRKIQSAVSLPILKI